MEGAGRPMPEWVKQAVTIVMAAGAAYMGIRLDLATIAANVATLKETTARHEAQIDRLREIREKIGENQK